jgi:predicted transcriptional regulator
MDAIYEVVAETPGLSGNELQKRVKGNRNKVLGTIQEMVAGHILTHMREGRAVKYYPYGYTMPIETMQDVEEEVNG